jgi:hypothetical protein
MKKYIPYALIVTGALFLSYPFFAEFVPLGFVAWGTYTFLFTFLYNLNKKHAQ